MSPKNYKQKQRRNQQKNRAYLKPETVIIIKQIFLGIIIFSVIGIIISGLWYGTRIEKLTISQIEVKDGQTIKGEVIEEKVREMLSGNYFHLIPYSFAWFYPKQDIIKNLAEIKKIKTVSVEEVSSQKLSISFEEYKPHALWCEEIDVEKECLFLDKDGFAFDEAPKLLGNNLIRYYLVGEKPILQKPYLETEDFKKIEQFVAFLNKINWYVARIEVDKELDVYMVLSEGGEIKISLREDVLETLKYLESLRESKEFEHLKPGNFRYVDLRYGETLYINEDLETEEEEGVEIDGSIEELEGFQEEVEE